MTFVNGDFGISLYVDTNGKYVVKTYKGDKVIQFCEYDSLLHACDKFTQYVRKHLAEVRTSILTP